MNAILSLQVGQAVLLERDNVVGWATAANYQPISQSLAVAARWMGGLTDLCFVDDCSVGEIQGQLKHAELRRSLLSLFAIIFDGQLTQETRSMAVGDLEELFSTTPGSENLLRALIFSRPMPKTANFEDVESVLADAVAPRVETLISAIRMKQAQIETVSRAWQRATAHLAAAEKASFFEVAVTECLFSRLSTKLDSDDVAVFQIETLENPTLRRLKGSRDVILRFVRELREAPRSRADLQGEESLLDELRIDRSRPFRRSIPLAELSERKEKQKFAIVYQLKRGHHSLVDRFTRELIEFQRIHDRGTQYVAMSMCHLAVQAKRMGQFPAQLGFTRLAIENSPEDAWSWSQHADALARNRHFREAFAACETAISLGNVIVGHAVRAGILKTLLRFEEALAIYDSLIEETPPNIVLFNARSETFKVMGYLNDALKGYDSVIRQFPRDIITHSARGDVLKMMGRYADALSVYDEIIREVSKQSAAPSMPPEDNQEELLFADDIGIQRLRSMRGWVLKSMGNLDGALRAFSHLRMEDPYYFSASAGRGSVLKALGRYSEALDAFNEALDIIPTDLMVRNARANLYVLMNRHDEAFAELSAEECLTASDWVSQHIRGIAHLKKGDIAAASQIFTNGLRASLPATIADHFRSGLAVCKLRRGQLKQALSALDGVSMPEAEIPANIIKMHVFGEAGRTEDCRRALRLFRSHRNPIVREIVDELQVRYVPARHRRRRRSDEWLFDAEIRLLSVA
jgi:tetratricopeptide (TPR) repeat protein